MIKGAEGSAVLLEGAESSAVLLEGVKDKLEGSYDTSLGKRRLEVSGGKKPKGLGSGNVTLNKSQGLGLVEDRVAHNTRPEKDGKNPKGLGSGNVTLNKSQGLGLGDDKVAHTSHPGRDNLLKSSCSGPYVQDRSMSATVERSTGGRQHNVVRAAAEQECSVSCPETNTGPGPLCVNECTYVQGYSGGSSVMTSSAQADNVFQRKPPTVRNGKSGGDSSVMSDDYRTRSGRVVRQPVQFGDSIMH